MQVTDELIRSVVQEVLAHMRNGKVPAVNGQARNWGVFDSADDAVAAASEAQREFEIRSLEDRRKLAAVCLRAASWSRGEAGARCSRSVSSRSCRPAAALPLPRPRRRAPPQR